MSENIEAKKPYQRRWVGPLMIAPAVAWVLAFTIFPLLYSLPKSFQETYRTAESRERKTRWVGLENYRRALQDREVRRSIVFTASAVVLAVALEVSLGFVLALAAFRHFSDAKSGWLKALFTAPMLAAPVAVAYLSLTFFAEDVGLVNMALSLAVDDASLPIWRGNPVWSLLAIVLVDCWQWTPFCFLMLSAALAGIPSDLFEAASVEGASQWTIARHIALPLTRPALLTVLLIRFIEALKIFDVPYVLTRGGPGTQTYTYTQWIWRIGLRDNNYELAAALSYLLLIPVAVGAAVLMKKTRSVWDKPAG